MTVQVLTAKDFKAIFTAIAKAAKANAVSAQHRVSKMDFAAKHPVYSAEVSCPKFFGKEVDHNGNIDFVGDVEDTIRKTATICLDKSHPDHHFEVEVMNAPDTKYVLIVTDVTTPNIPEPVPAPNAPAKGRIVQAAREDKSVVIEPTTIVKPAPLTPATVTIGGVEMPAKFDDAGLAAISDEALTAINEAAKGKPFTFRKVAYTFDEITRTEGTCLNAEAKVFKLSGAWLLNKAIKVVAEEQATESIRA